VVDPGDNMIIYYLWVDHILEFPRIVIEVLTVLSGILLNVDNEIIPRDKKMIHNSRSVSYVYLGILLWQKEEKT